MFFANICCLSLYLHFGVDVTITVCESETLSKYKKIPSINFNTYTILKILFKEKVKKSILHRCQTKI